MKSPARKKLEATGYIHCEDKRGAFQWASLIIKEMYKRGETFMGHMMRYEVLDITGGLRQRAGGAI